MTYRNFTPRCPHGFAIGIVPCDECKTKVLYGASSHLRRCESRRQAGGKIKPPATYRGQGTTGYHGNTNRGFRY